ncbi:MAG: AAA domain-containing protein [Actinomycetota bacterium]
MEETKLNNDFRNFLHSLCRYYMEFLETDFKTKRNPSRKIIFRNKDLLTSISLFKYEKLKKMLVEAISENFNGNKISNITKGKFTIKLSEETVEKITDDIEQIDFDNFQVEKIIRKIDGNLGSKFPDKEEFLEEIEFEIKSLEKDDDGKVSKEQIREILLDAVCYDFYDELYELWKNRTILEGEEIYLYFYEIEFKENRYPIFFMPITLNKQKSDDPEEISDVFEIEFGTQVLINKFAIEFISNAFNELINEYRAPINILRRHLYIGDFDVRAEMQKMMNEICSFFKLDFLNLKYVHPQNVKNEHVIISNNFYVAICDKSDESLLNDFEELMELINKGESSELVDILSKLGSDFLLENPKVFNLGIDNEYHEKELPDKLAYRSPIPLNEEQQKIISALRKDEIKNIIIEGPPGTGKSHTITAIIFYALLEHKTVLMTSDKKEALDVVEDKISSVLDKVKKEDDFLQNPLLRLGKQETNYSKIFKQQNYEKISNRFNASRRILDSLDKEIEGASKLISSEIKNQVDVYSSVDLSIIGDICLKEASLKNKFSESIDFNEAYENKNFIKFIKQLYDIIKVFEQKKDLFESLKDNIDWGNLVKNDSEHLYNEANSYLVKINDAILSLNNLDLKTVVRNSSQLKQLFSIEHEFPYENFNNLLKAYGIAEEQFKNYQDFLGSIFLDYKSAQETVINFDQYLSAIKETCTALMRMNRFCKDNFRRGNPKLSLVNDVTIDNILQIDKYIKTIRSLKTRFFGLIIKRGELREANDKLFSLFPSLNIKFPQRRLRQLEVENKLYQLALELRGVICKYSYFNRDFIQLQRLEGIVSNLAKFEFDEFLQRIQDSLVNFVKEEKLIKLTPYFQEIKSLYPLSLISDYKDILVLNRYLEVYREILKFMDVLRNLNQALGEHKSSPKSIVINPDFDIGIDFFCDPDNVKMFQKKIDNLTELINFYTTRLGLLNSIKDCRKFFNNTMELLKIDENDPNSLVNNKLCNYDLDDITELCGYFDKHYLVSENYRRLKNNDYGQEREDLENKLVLKMTHILDEAVVKFSNENLNDRQQIRDLIRKKKRIPKELLRKLIEAFPCLIVNIRDLGEYLPLEPEVFDIVIIDEASQVSIAQAFPAIIRGRKVVILGDKKQYSNVKSHNASIEINNFLFSRVKEDYKNYIQNYTLDKQQILSDAVNMFDVKKSVLDFLSRIANYSCSLRKHFRGYREIIGYSNKMFYNSYLQVMKLRSKPIGSVLNFHLLKNTDKNDIYSNVNSYECDFIISKLEELKSKGVNQSVGVITPFTNQQRFIYGEVLSHKDSDYFLNKMNLKVMTFDTCQGDEKDIVFYSFVERPGEEILRYIFPKDFKKLDDEEEGSIKAQRLNVGFSRAREEMHFVLSKDVPDISGEIGRALTHYCNELEECKKLPDINICQSEMEKFVLSLITQTSFYQGHKENIEIHAQFEIGRYLKQIHNIDTPKYRTDFLIVLRDDSNGINNIIIEYDGFEYHFRDCENIGIENYDKFYISQDIERQKIIESYGYHFIRLNRFIIRSNPIAFLEKRLLEIVKKNSQNDPLIEKVIADAEEISKGNIKQCPKCGVFKDLKEFVDHKTTSGLGRYCKECKSKKNSHSSFSNFILGRTDGASGGLKDLSVTLKNTDCFSSKLESEILSNDLPASKRAIIEKAIKEGKTLEIQYRSRYNKRTTRTIKPISINGDFVKAYCHLRQDNRTFRISHIKEIVNA